MDASEFPDLSSGRLVPTVEGALAFVPAPVPRTLDLDLAAVRLLADADHAIGRLAGTAGRLVSPYLVGSPLLHREAILSSRIEGTITTPEQLVILDASGSHDRRGRRAAGPPAVSAGLTSGRLRASVAAGTRPPEPGTTNGRSSQSIMKLSAVENRS